MTGARVTLTLDEVSHLARRALRACGCSEGNAAAQARAVVGAELDGIKSHGLAYLPIYCEHLRCGKVNGRAEPSVEALSAGAFRCDAGDGFALPAIDLLFAALIPAARAEGLTGAAIYNSYNCGILGQHAESLAEAGLVGLGFTNAPASIAPPGGMRPVIGTNPFACAVPDGTDGVAFVIDQSASVVAKSEVALRARLGEPIPEGWALDSEGRPTRDAAQGLAGSMVPAGGYKGFGAGLLVEVLAAAVSGATLGIAATSFGTNDGGPPRTGQFFMALDPLRFSGGAFPARIAALTSAIAEQDGARLPGDRRRAARARVRRDGVTLDCALHERILGYCG